MQDLVIRVVTDPPAPVRRGEQEARLRATGVKVPEHACDDYSVPYVSDGALGHGWECGLCGAFLQAG